MLRYFPLCWLQVERRKAEALSLEKRIKDYESRSSRTLTERAAAQQKVRFSSFKCLKSVEMRRRFASRGSVPFFKVSVSACDFEV